MWVLLREVIQRFPTGARQKFDLTVGEELPRSNNTKRLRGPFSSEKKHIMTALLNNGWTYFVNYVQSYHWPYIGVFLSVFFVSLWLDITLHKGQKLSVKNAAIWSLVWIAVALAFAVPTGLMLGWDKASLYLTGWMLEKTLAIDNLIAFIAIFSCFGIAARGNTHILFRILHWGIIGAVVGRFVFLFFLGVLVNIPHPYGDLIVAFLGLIVLYTAYKMWHELKAEEEDAVDYANHWSVRLTRKVFPVEPTLSEGKFFVRKLRDGRMRTCVTISFLALICVEVVDILFAFDSMPTIAAVVKDPNVMLSGTIMAVAGLRSLFFVLEALRRMLVHLDKAVIGLLVYLSFKLMGGAVGIHISPAFNLLIVALFLVGGVVASLLSKEAATPKDREVLPSVQENR